MLSLPEFAIKRPVTIVMLLLVIIALFVFSVLNIPLALKPDLSYPRLSVRASWLDASPEEVESHVTYILEEIAAAIPDVVNVYSYSGFQYSSVTLEFARDADMDYVRFLLNERIQLVKDMLPDGVNPEISDYIPEEFREKEFLRYGFSGPYEPEEIEEFINRAILNKIYAVEDVAGVNISGTRNPQVQILVHDNVDVSPSTIVTNVSSIGSRFTPGSVKFEQKEFFVELSDRIESVNEIRNLMITLNSGETCKLSEIADIEAGFSKYSTYTRCNGLPQVKLSISKEPTANTLSLSDRIKELIADNESAFPEDVTISLLEDESKIIRKELVILFKRGAYSILIIFVVLLLFLRRIQSSVYVLLSIFISESLAVIALYVFKIGLNSLSLAGLTIGFGMIVDNSIVIFENINRLHRKIQNLNVAITQGVKEVSLSLAASTFTTIIVFGPFLYLKADMKIFYMPFVYAIVFSLLSSLLVAFTFIPFVMKHTSASVIKKIKIKRESILIRIYQKVLKFLIKFRYIWIVLVLGLLAYSIWIYKEKVYKGNTWNWPDDSYIAIRIELPVGTRVEQVNYLAEKFEEQLEKTEGIVSYETTVRNRNAYIRVDFDEETKQTSYPLITREKLKAFATNLGNSRIRISGFGPSFGATGFGTSSAHTITINGFEYDQLTEVAEHFGLFLEKASRRVVNVDPNSTGWYSSGKLYEYTIEFNREMIAKFNTNIYEIIRYISGKAASNSKNFAKKINDKTYSFLIKDKNYNRFSIEDLRSLRIPVSSGGFVKLAEIAEIEKTEKLPSISRSNEMYTRNISFDFRGSGRKSQSFIKWVKKNYPLPEGFKFQKEQGYASFDEDKNQVNMLLLFAIILVYMVLASLFESFLYPFIIILTLPFAFIGIALIFYITDTAFEPTARVGLLLLTGIVVNNSIILVQHIVKYHSYKNLLHAVIQASKERITPIIMTSLTTILGLMPMVFSTKMETGDYWRMLAFSTIGGMVTSTIFVLTVTPILYYFMSRKKRREIERKI